MLLSINPPASCHVLCIHPVIQPCVCTHLCSAITPWLLPDFPHFPHSSIHPSISIQLSTSLLLLPFQKRTNSSLVLICSLLLLPTHSFPCHLAINLFLSNNFVLSHLAPSAISLKAGRGKASMEEALPHLEEDLRCHGEAVGDDGLLLRGPAFPAVQLHAAAAGQQRLAVHFGRGRPRKLPSCRREAQP